MGWAKTIRLVAFDVDGVLTDGMLYYGPSGDAMKAFSVRDGMGISLGRAAGLKTAVVTGRLSEMVAKRAADLHVDYVIQNAGQKGPAMEDLCRREGFALDEVAYMGDDLNDAALIQRAGLGGTPADGCAEARDAADFISAYAGGHGALREFVEYILKEQDQWQQVVTQYVQGAMTLKQ